MKLIVSGATGFVATEVIRQSLSMPSITTVVALARRPVQVPENLGAGADPSKLRSVVVDDFGAYSGDVEGLLAGADACIWALAITPSKARSLPFEQVRRVCQDYTMIGLKTIAEARNKLPPPPPSSTSTSPSSSSPSSSSTPKASPLRFLYISGVAAERDQTKPPRLMAQYSLMRGETETQVLNYAYASTHAGEVGREVEASIAKPGLIVKPGNWLSWLTATILYYTVSLPSVGVVEMAAALLDQVVRPGGFEGETLSNADLVRIGRRALKMKQEQ